MLPDHDYPTVASKAAFFDGVIDAVDGIPGVEAACVVNRAPLDGRFGGMTFVPDGESRLVGATPLTVSPQCFGVLRIPLKRGRVFTKNDPAGAAALVSESIARELFKGADPIGRRIHVGLPDGPVLTVVGVVGDIRPLSLESSFANQVWMTYQQGTFEPRQLLVRGSAPPSALLPAIRGRIRALDPRLPVATVRTMDDLREALTSARRFDVQLLVEFGAVSVLLCALGVYGLLAQVVGYRTPEIGVRLALGARPAHVVRDVVGGTAASILAGAAGGAVAAWALSRFIRGFLFGVSPTSPLVYGATIVFILGTAMCAAWIPARRAARLDPLIALRRE